VPRATAAQLHDSSVHSMTRRSIRDGPAPCTGGAPERTDGCRPASPRTSRPPRADSDHAGAGAAPLHAQSVVDGRRVEFQPSSENDLIVDGVAVVSGYTLNIYVAGSSTVTSTAHLGKPTPDTDGFMRVAYLSLLTTPLQVGVTYEARVVADGPGDRQRAPCRTRSPSRRRAERPRSIQGVVTIGAAASTGTVAVTSMCAWGSIANNSWITVTSGGSRLTRPSAPTGVKIIR
jgi:hypothetical protein